ncbi:MAG: hypothetical protein MR830_06060, partial [Succinatimonas sp.]|nr:hypothetical protein [Succinatimonas sp.]
MADLESDSSSSLLAAISADISSILFSTSGSSVLYRILYNADMMSVINTCMLNRVPVREYLLWLVANIRLRLNKMVASGYKDKTLFKMPGRR